jgi:hypothetical protein
MTRASHAHLVESTSPRHEPLFQNFWRHGMTNQETGRGICQFCSKTFTILAELDAHLKTAHSSKKPQMEGDRPGIEPADKKPTTELPPGVEGMKSGGRELP